jgi:hypothetical protein
MPMPELNGYLMEHGWRSGSHTPVSFFPFHSRAAYVSLRCDSLRRKTAQ